MLAHLGQRRGWGPASASVLLAVAAFLAPQRAEAQVAPVPPPLHYPTGPVINGAVGYVWGAASSDSSITGYTLEVSSTPDFNVVLLRRTVTATGYTPVPAERLPSGFYYWRVTATDSEGDTATSALATFSVLPREVSYRLLVDTDPSLASPDVDQRAIGGTSYTLRDHQALAESPTYSWSVIAQDEAGNTRTTNTWSFQLADAFPPAAPEAIYPPVGARVISPRPTLIWRSSPEATSFDVVLTNDASFLSTLYSTTTSATSWQVPANLPRDTRYYWRVIARDAQGNAVPSHFSFVVENTAPVYTLEVARNPTFSPVEVREPRLTNASYTLEAHQQLAVGVTYHWRVTATDLAGNSRTTTTNTLAITDIFPPVPAQAIHPVPGAEILNPSPLLMWQPPPDAVGYQVTLSRNADLSNPLVQTNTTQSRLQVPTPLEQGGRYYWRIVSRDAQNNQSASATFNFTVHGAPVVYRLEVAREATFVSIVASEDRIPATQFQLRPDQMLPDNGTLHWRVTAEDTAGNSRTSTQVFSLQMTDSSPPTAVIALYPENNTTVINPRLTYRWTTAQDDSLPVTYRLQVSDAAQFTTLALDKPGLTQPFYHSAVVESLPAGRYYWRVVTTDARGNNGTSPISSFVVQARSVRYALLIDEDPLFVNPSTQQRDLTANAYTLRADQGLRDGVTYHWKVIANDGAGNSRESGSTFTLAMADNFAPTLPTPIYPPRDQAMLSSQACFRWTTSTDPNGVSYRVEVSQLPGFVPLAASSDFQPATGVCLPGVELERGGQYYWRVVVRDGIGNQAATNAFPLRIAPSTVAYSVDVSTDPTFLTTIYTRSNITNLGHTLADASVLAEGATYYWRVTARDPAGHGRLSASTFSFTLADTFPPTQAVAVNPAPDATVLNPRVTFMWNGGDDAGPVTHTVQLAREPIFVRPAMELTNITGKAVTLSAAQALEPGTTYFWRVISTDARGNSIASNVFRFVVGRQEPSYDLVLQDGSGVPVGRWLGLENPNYTLSTQEGATLREGQTFSWYVIARDAAGNTRNSNIFTFNLSDTYPPPPPLLLYPEPDAVVLNPRAGFVWSTVEDPNLVRYRLEVSEDASFATTVVSVGGLTTPRYALAAAEALQRGRTYHWRVAVEDNLGNTGASSVRAFTVSSDAVEYTLTLTPSLPEVRTIRRDRISLTSYTLTPDDALQDGVPYSWVVTATDGAGNSRQSTSTFTLDLGDIYPPPLPIPLYPAPGASVINPLVGFAWENVVDPHGVTYGLQVSRTSDFATTLINQGNLATPAFQAASALSPGAYYWRVTVQDSLGNQGATPGFPLTVKPRSVDYLIELADDGGGALSSPFLSRRTTTASYTPNSAEALVEGLYVWRVTAYDEARNTRVSAESRFSLADNFPPPMPVLTYPAAEVEVINPLVAYAWTGVQDSGNSAVTYTIEVDDASDFLTPLLRRTGLTLPKYDTRFTERLPTGSTYFWRVTAQDALGHSITTLPRRFSVGTQRVTYEFLLARDASFQDVAHSKTSLSTSSYPLPAYDALRDGITYHWKVTAYDSARNATPARTPFTLHLEDVFPPEAPELLYPRANEVLINNEVAFVWSRADDGGGAVRYELEVSESTDFTTPLLRVDTADRTTHALTGANALERNRNYWWRVRAIDPLGNAVVTAPSVFGLAPRSIRYTVEVATDAAFTQVIHTAANLRDPRHTTPLNDSLPMNVDLHWRVHAVDVLGRRTTSASVFTFNIRTLPLVQAGGVLGTYYDGIAFNEERVRRIDPVIDFPEMADRNLLGDFDTAIGGDTFSVRWQGWVKADFNESYTFYATADDGHRLWVDGTLLVDSWAPDGLNTRSGTIALTPGWHSLQYEMFENLAGAVARLEYASASITRRVIPADHLAIILDPSDAIAPELRDVYITAVTPDHATVHVVSNKPVSVTVNYGSSAAYGQSAGIAATALEQDVVLTAVPPGTLHYQVVLTDGAGNVYTSGDLLGCTPAVSDLVMGELRRAAYRGTDFGVLAADQTDTTIDLRGPIGSLNDNFSVRWSGLMRVPVAGSHTFLTTSDDGQRLYIDGIRRINDWVEHAATQQTATFPLDGGWHAITYELFQATGLIQGTVQMQPPGAASVAMLPTAQLARLPATFFAPTIGSLVAVPPVEATSPSGAVVTLTAPSVTDCRDPRPTISGNAPPVLALGGNVVTWTAQNRFGEFTRRMQLVNVVDTTPPTLSAGDDLTVACDAPLGDARTPKTRVGLNTPALADVADAAPRWFDDAPDVFPLGPTTINVTAQDASGNQARDSYVVTVVEAGNIQVDAGEDLVVAQMNDCTLPDMRPGTRVRLRQPTARGSCRAEQDITLTHDYPVAGSTALDLCVPSGATTITWSARGGGTSSGTDSVTVTVVLTDFTLVVDSSTTGYVNTQGEVTAHVTGTFTAPLTWEARSTQLPTSVTSDDAGNFQAEFAQEGVYCPLNVLATDSVGRRAVTTQPCFGVDKTPPITDFTMPTTWVAADDPSQLVAVDPADRTTWPHFFTGENQPMAQRVSDIDGVASSGVQSAVLTWLDMEMMPIARVELGRNSWPAAGNPASGPMATDFSGCTLAGVCQGGALDLAALGRGARAVEVEITDTAGNRTAATFYMAIKDFKDAVDHGADWVAGLAISPFTPPSAEEQLTTAKGFLETAGRLHLESPGHGFLLASNAWDQLSDAESYGASVSFLTDYLPRAMKSDVRRLAEVTGAANLPDWSLLGGGDAPYLTSPNITGEFVVQVADVLAAAQTQVDLADSEWRLGQYTASMAASRAAYQRMSILFDDNIYAGLFGTPVHYVDAGNSVAEAYFRNAERSDLGTRLAATVANRIRRVEGDPGVPPAVRAPLTSATNRLDLFSASVARIGNDPTFGNLDMMEDVYLNAQVALEELATIQRASFDTHDWRTGVILTLSYVLNFSLYDGPTAMQTIIRNADPQLPTEMLDVSECRYRKAMDQLKAGDVAPVVETYLESKCLMVENYNRYYGGFQYFPTDACLDPEEYGCPVRAGSFGLGGCPLVDLTWDATAECQ